MAEFIWKTLIVDCFSRVRNSATIESFVVARDNGLLRCVQCSRVWSSLSWHDSTKSDPSRCHGDVHWWWWTHTVLYHSFRPSHHQIIMMLLILCYSYITSNWDSWWISLCILSCRTQFQNCHCFSHFNIWTIFC